VNDAIEAVVTYFVDPQVSSTASMATNIEVYQYLVPTNLKSRTRDVSHDIIT
jgi:hypothetical protein